MCCAYHAFCTGYGFYFCLERPQAVVSLAHCLTSGDLCCCSMAEPVRGSITVPSSVACTLHFCSCLRLHLVSACHTKLALSIYKQFSMSAYSLWLLWSSQLRRDSRWQCVWSTGTDPWWSPPERGEPRCRVACQSAWQKTVLSQSGGNLDLGRSGQDWMNNRGRWHFNWEKKTLNNKKCAHYCCVLQKSCNDIMR